MPTPSLRIAAQPRPDPELRLDALVLPFVRRWRLVAAVALVAWAAGLALVLVPARRYAASTVLAAVPSARTAALAGGLSSLLGAAQMGGVQSTPFFITKLLMMRGVVTAVAMAPAADGARERVIERVLERPLAKITPGEVEPAMRDLLTSDVDKQTGLVSFAVTHTDSALARRIAERLVAEASETYTRVSRSQAAAQRAALEVRVDSAERALRRAEQQQLDVLSANRAYTSYSAASVARQRAERELSNAQGVYERAVDDRDGAIARQLEEAPALVVVDPLPAVLAPTPRHGLLKMLLATALGLLTSASLLLARGEFAPARAELRTAA